MGKIENTMLHNEYNKTGGIKSLKTSTEIVFDMSERLKPSSEQLWNEMEGKVKSLIFVAQRLVLINNWFRDKKLSCYVLFWFIYVETRTLE